MDDIFFSTLAETAEEVDVGIDEAGRGPVLGYLVYAALAMPRGCRFMNFRDSKILTAVQRSRLFEDIAQQGLGYVYHCISPTNISETMLSGSKTLNDMSIESVQRILREVGRTCRNVGTVYIDALGNCETYRRRLEKDFPYRFVIAEKADSKFQAVSGASIVAKVKRDALISELGDVGSGYPADPNTVAWLRRSMDPVFGFPSCVRHSWGTAKRMLGERQSKPLKGIFSGFYLDHK